MIKKVVHIIHRTQKTPMNCPLMSTLTDDEKACTISGTVKFSDIDFSSC